MPSGHALNVPAALPGEPDNYEPITNRIVQTDITTLSPLGGRRRISAIELMRYEGIARRLLMQQTVEEIAESLHLGIDDVESILRRPGFKREFQRIRREIFKDVDTTIANEEFAPLVRMRAATTRAVTLVNEIMEEVRTRVKDGRARAMDLKVGSELAFGIMDRGRTELSKGAGAVAGGGGVTVTLNATVVAGVSAVVGEAGVDMSDLMGSLIEGDSLPVDPTTPVTP